MTEPTVVKLRIPRSAADHVDDVLMGFDEANVPSLSAFAPEEGADIMDVEAYFPDAVDEAALQSLLPDYALRVEALPDVDWVSQSQSMLPAITAGRFHVYGAHVADTLRPGQVGLWIEANQAFGTGRHETTYGCLKALDWLLKQRRYKRILDLGCGSGVLGLGAAKARPVPVVMSDLDPVSIDVARENAQLNQVPMRLSAKAGRGAQIFTATGLADPRLRAAAPYDLILANILARPLQDLAQSITGAASPDGNIVLAGLLDTQEAAVLSRYLAHGWRLKKRISTGHWPTLILRKSL
ncbi:MAG: 50S ribosomal protein L11 methyltransferase [Pseudomonadota bacterium]